MTKTPLDVLIVEDEVWLGEQFSRTLQQAGYSTRVTSNGHAAMDLIDELRPRVIMLDMLLSGGTGLALLHELQSYTDTGDIPVVLCTNIAGDLDVKDLRPYGVRRLLDKTTMHPDDVTVAIRSVLV